MKTSILTIAFVACAILLSGCTTAKTPQEQAQKFVEKNNEFCTQEPTKNRKDQDVYPVIPQYEQLSALGQLFTASHCGPERVEQLPTVTDGQYTAGSLIWLPTNPSDEFFEALKTAGFVCSGGAEGNCKKWRLETESVPYDTLTALEPFSAEIAEDDCFYCK